VLARISLLLGKIHSNPPGHRVQSTPDVSTIVLGSGLVGRVQPGLAAKRVNIS
jgi:hypothetical protein